MGERSRSDQDARHTGRSGLELWKAQLCRMDDITEICKVNLFRESASAWGSMLSRASNKFFGGTMLQPEATRNEAEHRI